MKNSIIIICSIIILLLLGEYFFELSKTWSYAIGAAIILLTISIPFIIRSTYERPIKNLVDKSQQIEKGEISILHDHVQNTKYERINHSLSLLTKSIQNALSFITSLERGDYEKEYDNLEEKFDDKLANSLVNLRDKLKKIAEEDKIRNWVTEGLAKFVDILRSVGEEDLDSLADRILSNLVKYVNANQGQLFIFNDDNPDEPFLELIAFYAYERKKYNKISLDTDTGLIGQAFREKDTIHLKEVPQNFVTVTSGLGESTPSNVLIVPLKVNEDVYGIIEIASFNDFEPHEIDFIEKLGESIASTISTARLNERTRKLLEDSRQQSEELRAQEEEMRQNMEELQATQEEVQRQVRENEKMQKDLIKEKAYLEAVMNYLPEYFYFKDLDSKFLKISKSMLKIFPVNNLDEMIGKSDFDFIDEETAQTYYDEEQDIIKTRRGFVNKIVREVFENGMTQWSSITKMPLMDEEGNCIGTFGITKDITELKKLEEETNVRNEELQAQEEELRQNLEEMQATQEELQRQLLENTKIQESLAKEKALMDSLMDNIPDYIYFKDKDSKFIRISRSMLKMFPVKKLEQMIGKSDFDFHSKEGAQSRYDQEQQIIKNKKGFVDQIDHEILENGLEQWVSTTKLPLLDSEGNAIGTFGITKEITSLKNLEIEAKNKNEELQAQEEELRQNLEEMQATQEELERQLRENTKMQESLSREKALMDSLMDNIPDYIYFKDKDSKFIRISRSMLKMFPIKKLEQMIGKSDFDFHSKEGAQSRYEQEQQIIKNKKGFVDQIDHEILENGLDQWVSTTKLPLLDQEGKAIGTFGITKDITKLKTLEIEIKKQNDELKSQEESLRETLEDMKKKEKDYLKQIEELKKKK